SELDSGPGSSSYELKAITEDLEQPQPAADRRDPWGHDPGAVPSNGSGDDRGPQPVPSIRTRKRTDEPIRRHLQRGVGLAPRPRRRHPLLAGRSGPLHPWTSASTSKKGENNVLFGKDRFAELAPEPILEPPLPGSALSPVVTSRPRNIQLHQQPNTTGKRRAWADPRRREEYARGDLNPQPSAPEADALSS